MMKIVVARGAQFWHSKESWAGLKHHSAAIWYGRESVGIRNRSSMTNCKSSILHLSFFVFQIILNSMHRFQPRIYLVIRPEGANHPITDIEQEKYRTYIFPETIFTAVTAYQNQLVSLKKLPYLHRPQYILLNSLIKPKITINRQKRLNGKKTKVNKTENPFSS